MTKQVTHIHVRRPRPREARWPAQGHTAADKKTLVSPGSQQEGSGWYKSLQPRPMPQGWVCSSHFRLPCAHVLHPVLPLPCPAIPTPRCPLYLHPNVHHHGIQEVEDTGGDAIASVLGEPAVAAQYVFGPLGGHGQAQLLHQPAALGGGPIMAQLGGDTPAPWGWGTNDSRSPPCSAFPLPFVSHPPPTPIFSVAFQRALHSLIQVPPVKGGEILQMQWRSLIRWFWAHQKIILGGPNLIRRALQKQV